LNRTVRTLLIYGFAIMAVALIAQAWFNQWSAPREVALTEFLSMVDEGRVAQAEILARSNQVEARLTGSPAGGYDVIADYPDGWEGELTETLRTEDIPFTTDNQPDGFWAIILGLLPWLFLLGFMVFMFMQMQGSGNRVMQFGKAKAKMVTKEQPKVTFADVAGLDEAIEEVQELKDYLQNPDRYRSLGAKIPKGVLLFGPPGAGKTLLAKAVAGEAGVPFLSISGSDFVEMFVGVGASRVRDLFDQAKTHAPAIVFIDEIDAVGRHRGAGLGGGHDEREQTLNQLLVELDGFDTNTGVIVIAATNRPDILDPALLRPGRFDRQIVIDGPDIVGRKAILEVHSRGKPLAGDIDLDVIARRTPGFTGADLANVINEAALLTVRRRKTHITMLEVEEAIDRVMSGPERKSRVMTEDEKVLIAYHETGHALVGWALPMADPVHKITIVARGRSLGHTLALPTHDKNIHRRSELVDRLATLLGGRTAEEVIYGDPTTGAENDIKNATEIARRMVMQYGMSDRLGPMQYGRPGGEVFLGRDYTQQQDYSDEVAAFIDEEVRLLITAAHEEARLVIDTHREAMERMVQLLLQQETVGPDEVAKVFFDVPKWEHAPDGAIRIKRPEGPVEAAPLEPAAMGESDEPQAADPPRKSRKMGLPRMKPADLPGS
jgi:cell division protease FtsH